MSYGHGGRWPGVERHTAAWSRAADEVGGTLIEATATGRPAIQLDHGDSLITLDFFPMETRGRTRMRAPFWNPRGVLFSVKDAGFFDDLLEQLGFIVDVEVGHRAFDARFTVKGYPASDVREVLADPVPALLLAQERVELEVWDAARVRHLPPGTADLRFATWDILQEPAPIASLFQAFREMLTRLSPPVSALASEPDLLIRRLVTPGGERREPMSNLLLWDGDTPRVDAAEALGRLGGEEAVEALTSVLDDEQPRVVVAALDALAELKAGGSVERVVLLLGEVESEVGGRNVSAAAADTLEALGEGALARAFQEALDGRPARLKDEVGPYRTPVIEALMDVVESHDFAARVHAATALGRLGANEALPLLRSSTRNMGMKTRLTAAAQAAIEEIESRAGLLRPADGPPGRPDTHPRPAERPGLDTSRLPRSTEQAAPEGGKEP